MTEHDDFDVVFGRAPGGARAAGDRDSFAAGDRDRRAWPRRTTRRPAGRNAARGTPISSDLGRRPAREPPRANRSRHRDRAALPSMHGVPSHPRASAVRLRRDRCAEDGSRRSDVDVIDLGFGNPDIPSPASRSRSSRKRPEPAQPSVLDDPRRAPSAARDHGSLPAALRSGPRPRDRGVRHHRCEGRVLAPHVGAARSGRHRTRPEPVLPDPHLGPDPRGRGGALRAHGAGQDFFANLHPRGSRPGPDRTSW